MSNPIRGATRALTPTVNYLNASIHNRFDVEVIDTKTGKIKQQAYGENVILNNLWSKINAQYFGYIQYGTGSGTPAATDTRLFAFLGGKAAGDFVDNNDTANHVYSARKKITLSEIEAVGSTITEVGIASGSTATDLLTHAMLKDMNGNQISIAKTSTDIVNIYATIFVKYSGFGNGFFVYKEFLSWAAGCSPYNFNNDGGFGLYSRGSPDSTSKDISSVTLNSSEKKFVVNMARCGVGTASSKFNLHGINKITSRIEYYDNGYRVANAFDILVTNIPSLGSNITGEAIGTGNGSTVDFATYFTDTTNATIYVDGVAATGVTVDNTSAVANNVHFATAPATGAVITGDYHTAVVAKDANHVFDLTVTIQLGEYTS